MGNLLLDADDGAQSHAMVGNHAACESVAVRQQGGDHRHEVLRGILAQWALGGDWTQAPRGGLTVAMRTVTNRRWQVTGARRLAGANLAGG